MARPIKQGINYFPIDCEFDSKTKMYLLETEANGLAVLVALWQIIYSDEGYYVECNKDLSLLVKDKVKIEIEIINECINKAVLRELFNPKLFKEYNILTSNGIQKRFFEISKRKKEITYDERFIINGISIGSNAIKANKKIVTKKKKSPEKIKYTIFKFQNVDKKDIKFVKLPIEDWEKLIERTSLKYATKMVQKVDAWYRKKGKKVHKDDYLTICQWMVKDKKEKVIL